MIDFTFAGLNGEGAAAVVRRRRIFPEGTVATRKEDGLWPGLSAPAIFSLNSSEYLSRRAAAVRVKSREKFFFRKERRVKVHGKEGKCRRVGLLPKRDGEDFFRQEAGCPRSTYDRTVARVF